MINNLNMLCSVQVLKDGNNTTAKQNNKKKPPELKTSKLTSYTLIQKEGYTQNQLQ